MDTSEPHTSTVLEAARSGEPDRYLAALLAPAEQREALLALAAFSAELARIPLRIVREPTMGEIRLQWWRDALDLPVPLQTGNPIADALRAAARQHDLPTRLLDAMIDARSLLLDQAGAFTEPELSEFLSKSEGALFALGARVTGLALEPDFEAGCANCGRAYGLTRLLLELPQMAAHGLVPLAAAQLEAAGLTVADMRAGLVDARVQTLVDVCSAQIEGSLAAARQFTRQLPRSARVAFLPLALVRPYLRALKRSGPALLRTQARVAPLTRVWKIGAAHVLGRW
jgi:15-cis-phytoene synthase